MAGGQTDEGGYVDRTGCVSIQHPLIRPCGAPSPLSGEGFHGKRTSDLPPSRGDGFAGSQAAQRTFPLREGPLRGIFLAKQEFFLYFTARI